jgi:general secretion pathway protein G
MSGRNEMRNRVVRQDDRGSAAGRCLDGADQKYACVCSHPARRIAGFTLIELLIVIVILGLLLSLVAPTMFSKVGSSQRKTAMAQMQMLSTALDTYRLDIGDYPARLEDLRSGTAPGWDGPYLPRELPLDPWGNPYVYGVQSSDPLRPYSLKSFGKDGREGGEADNEDIIFQ